MVSTTRGWWVNLSSCWVYINHDHHFTGSFQSSPSSQSWMGFVSSTSRALLLGSRLMQWILEGFVFSARAEGSWSRAAVKYRNLISELVRVSSRWEIMSGILHLSRDLSVSETAGIGMVVFWFSGPAREAFICWPNSGLCPFCGRFKLPGEQSILWAPLSCARHWRLVGTRLHLVIRTC